MTPIAWQKVILPGGEEGLVLKVEGAFAHVLSRGDIWTGICRELRPIPLEAPPPTRWERLLED